jgi:hypothetical protein
MVVWLAEQAEQVEVPGEDGVVSNGIRVGASHCRQGDTLLALNDGLLPKTSNDHSIPRMTWWDHKGTRKAIDKPGEFHADEWVSYRYPKAREVSSAEVYWFDDTGVGSCRVPAAWRLLWLDGTEWKPVKLAKDAAYGTALDKFNVVRFEPVTTQELRLEVELSEGVSAGVLEWRVK